MLALVEYEAGVCECGFHKSQISDPNNHYTFAESKCNVCAGIAQFGRIKAANDERARKHRGQTPPPGAPDPADGRKVFVKQMTPDEVRNRSSKQG